MSQSNLIAVDLTKDVFQIALARPQGKAFYHSRLTWKKFEQFLAKADEKFGTYYAALSERRVARRTHDGANIARSRSTRGRIYACNESNLMKISVSGCGRSPYRIC